ncbi:MAG: hypothetical protein CL561_13290 [Alphaproteobacteria bacterium]|nr:hypothetical protein [Alphaproteobacteria bacterium]
MADFSVRTYSDPHIMMASDIEAAAHAYEYTDVNTVLVLSPLAGVFDAVAKRLSATELDGCKPFLERLRPWEIGAYHHLSAAQQDLIGLIKEKEDILSDVFNFVTGAGGYIDSLRYVPSRRGVYRTAIPHIDECDSHMTATLFGRRGTLLYLRDYFGIPEHAFKTGTVQVKPHEVIEANPTHLCFIKGTDHLDVLMNPDMGARWHSSPVIDDPQEARLASFCAMKNGLGYASALYG